MERKDFPHHIQPPVKLYMNLASLKIIKDLFRWPVEKVSWKIFSLSVSLKVHSTPDNVSSIWDLGVAGNVGQSLKTLLLSVDHNHCNDPTFRLASDVNGNIFHTVYSFCFVFCFHESFSFQLGYTVLICLWVLIREKQWSIAIAILDTHCSSDNKDNILCYVLENFRYL